jgi:hypothetical protein
MLIKNSKIVKGHYQKLKSPFQIFRLSEDAIGIHHKRGQASLRNKELRRAHLNMTVTSRQGLPPAPDLLQSSLM